MQGRRRIAVVAFALAGCLVALLAARGTWRRPAAPTESPVGTPVVLAPAPQGEVPAPRAGPAAGGPSLRGIVVDAGGAPLAGVDVAAALPGERVPARTTTGADGRFSLPVASATEGYLVGFRSPGMASVLRGGVRADGGEIRVVLAAPGSLSGRVLDSEGRPCPGARVRAMLLFPGVPKDLGGFEVRADESGGYAFQALPSTEVSLAATYDGRSSPPVEVRVVPARETRGADLVVDLGPTLEGIVLDAEGRPLDGVSVCATPERSGRKGSEFAETDPGGRFVLRRLDEVPYRLAATHPDALWEDPGPRRAVAPAKDIEIRMVPNPRPPSWARFRIVDSDGKPVRSARFLAFRGEEAEPCGSGDLQIDEAGIARTGRLVPGRNRFEVRGRDGFASTGEFTAEPGRTADLGTIRLSPGVAVKGRLLGPDGRPASKARLFLEGARVEERGAVEADGTFTVRGLAPGGRVEARLHGCLALPIPWKGGAGDEVDVGDVPFRAATGVVHGTVRSRSGSRVEGALVSLSPWSEPGIRTDDREIAADASGRYEAAALAPGEWTVSARPPDPEERRKAGASASFTSSGDARKFALADGERREIDLEID